MTRNRWVVRQKLYDGNPTPSDGEALSAWDKVELENLRLRNDILRIRLEREKLRAEKEKQCTVEEELISMGGVLKDGDPFEGIETDKMTEKERECTTGPVQELWGEIEEKLKVNEFLHTFLCQNCGEAVSIPSAQVGKKVHWKCMVCHQENHFDSDYQGGNE